jgi:formylglycine-generating enzyme required for sulfatase activity
MIGLEILLSAAISAVVKIAADAGLGELAHELHDRLKPSDETLRKTAFEQAYKSAVNALGDSAGELEKTLDHRPFQEALAAAILDPASGLDLKAVSSEWQEKLPAYAPALKRFFLKLHDALMRDEYWGEILSRFEAIRDAEPLNEKLDLSGLVRQVSLEIHGNAAVAIDHSIAVAPGGVFLQNSDRNIIYTGTVYYESGEPRPSEQKLLEDYLAYVLKTCGYVPLSGVDPKTASQAREQLNLGAVYTALLTRETEQKEARAEGMAEKVRQLSAVEQLNRQDRLVLLGEPGGGKSTFVNFVAMCLAGQRLGDPDVNLGLMTSPLSANEGRPEPAIFSEKDKQKTLPQPWDHGALLPVRIILRDFAARGLPDASTAVSAKHVQDFIAAELKEADLAEFAPLLHKEMTEKGALVMFDGLDEIPEADQRRLQIKQAVESFASAHHLCRVLVTSRIFAYLRQDWKLDGFAQTTLALFTRSQVDTFIDRWYTFISHARNLNREDAQGRAALLKGAIRSSGSLFELAQRPLLLTLMASLHAWRGGSLTDQREQLYRDTVDLLLDWWESQRIVRDSAGKILMIQPSVSEWLQTDRQKVRLALNTLAFQAHASQISLEGVADISENDLMVALLQASGSQDARPGRLLEFLSTRAGLLVPSGVGVYAFPHRTFQEYLAACYLTDHDYPEQVAELVSQDFNRWREVALLAGAKAAYGAASTLWELVDALCYQEPTGQPGEQRQLWGAYLASLALVEGKAAPGASERNRPKLNRVKGWLVHILAHGELPVIERCRAGTALGQLGDPRFDDDFYFLPKANDGLLDFILIPAGSFLMGSDPKQDGQAYEDETPQHSLDLPAFYIQRYPVTVAQFAAFVNQSGYKPRNPDMLRGITNYPVTSVTWYDALAYCRWLEDILRLRGPESLRRLLEDGWQLTLPSEAQWEKAARGENGQVYPWGNAYNAENANTFELGIGANSPVGSFPGGVSPYGVMDMSGNALEWTRSLWGPDFHRPEYAYPYSERLAERENLEASKTTYRVLRGGSWKHESKTIRCACRLWHIPIGRDDYIGFRVAISPVLK